MQDLSDLTPIGSGANAERSRSGQILTSPRSSRIGLHLRRGRYRRSFDSHAPSSTNQRLLRYCHQARCRQRDPLAPACREILTSSRCRFFLARLSLWLSSRSECRVRWVSATQAKHPEPVCPRSSTNKIGFPLRSWRSMRSLPTISPLALNQGPLPIRSRASVGLLLFAGSRSTLKYARHVLSPCPTAVAKVWQIRSAPAKPPRLPVLLLALVTKNPCSGVARRRR
jgi:hypothetical protein